MYHIANFYDKSINTDNYFDRLAEFVDSSIKQSESYNIYFKKEEKPIVLDCACGSGRLVKKLNDMGYDMIGLDISEEMLDVARDVCRNTPALFICQDMCEMDLFGSVAAITCMTDSINHITDMKKLNAFFARAHNFLDPGGVLIFDCLTDKNFRDMTESKCFFEDYDWGSCFWNGIYDSRRRICRYNISYFEYAGQRNEEEMYIRKDDYIVEKIWSLKTVLKQLYTSGFKSVEMYDNTDFSPANKESKRVYFVAVK